VEEILLEHPGVSEACVVGAPDSEWGEVVVAFIVGAADPAELDAHLLQRIARFKRPKRYEFVDELPKKQLRQGAQAGTARKLGVRHPEHDPTGSVRGRQNR
jgi:fatty-acyl-CoA synthase